MKKWQPGFISFEHPDGDAGMPGARSRVKYKMGKREIGMIETIIKRNIPDVFSVTYETGGMWNRIDNYFIENTPEKTTRKTVNEFKAGGLSKIFIWFMPGQS